MRKEWALLRLIRIVIGLALGWVAFAVQADDLDALYAKLSAIDSISANFDLINTDADGAALNERGGELVFVRPGYLRMYTQPPYEQLVVSDNEFVYQYDPDLEQVIVEPLSRDLQQTPILLLAGNKEQIDAGYAVERLDAGDSGYEVFLLQNRDSGSLIDSVQLQFAAEHLLSIKVTDTQGSSNLLLLSASEQNLQVDASEFDFEAPDGVDVLRYVE